jgi:leucyl aminopeptidase
MADLYQLRQPPEEPLDCLYVLHSMASSPFDALELTAQEREALKERVEALAPRGDEGEVISGECPLPFARRLTLIGLGEDRNLSPSRLRKALQRAIRQATKNREYQIGLAIPAVIHGMTDAESRLFALREAALADYTFDHFKSKKNEFDKIDGLHILPMAGESEEELEGRLQRIRLLRASVQMARDLGNRPANDLTVEALATAARDMCEEVSGLRITVLGARELLKDKMGGILAVGQGSVQEPLLIVIEHRPKKPKKSVVLVGKGITFDSGGLSIKPAKGMGWMKYDMCGAAAVLAVMRAVGELEMPIKVVGLIPVADNMPSAAALRPGDIVTMASGRTVEIESTDAEGRLILADALHYAARFNPDIMLDFATLTGACKVALGSEAAAIMGNDEELVSTLVRLGETVGERVWPLPLYDEYLSYLKSDWADIRNCGDRWGGTVTAGVFLKQFVPDKVAWAHLDIAGVAYHESEHNGFGKGATGFGVVLATTFLEQLLR